eukprot:TRINITY_DN3307_c0_g1_i1.p1 TRINITY_DN3307_c0_g1~~TRINITY_DN3307_c0_g1_i1.p1  ORF type:complete len:182 (-),score=48.23 TRINITY_DN3307_c0_g1_i1:49-594(-)
MDQQHNDEYDLQPYFPFEESPEPLLPYHWDGDCHLIVNDGLYSNGLKLPDSPSSPSFEIEQEEVCELMEDCFDCEVQSVASKVTVSTAGSTEGVKTERKETLNDRLDFIMTSGKRCQKDFLKQKKYKRNRKTKEQLEILAKELENMRAQGPDAVDVDETASRTGLSETQVYKWIWDHKLKE